MATDTTHTSDTLVYKPGPPIEYFTKDPGETLDYTVDWSGSAADGGPWLASGDTISTSSWIVPGGITKSSSSNTTTTATITLKGGTHNSDYDLVNEITTANGLKSDRTIRLRVRER